MDSHLRQNLTALYAVERQDDAQSAAVSTAILALGMTYVIAGTGFMLSKYQAGKLQGVPLWLQLAGPSITIAIFGFFVLTSSSTWVRARLLTRLEALLGTNPDQADERLIGAYVPSFRTATMSIFEPRPRGFELFYLFTSIVSYGIFCAVVVGFTAICLVPGPWVAAKVVAAVVYGATHVLQIVALFLPQHHPHFRRADVPEAVVATCQEISSAQRADESSSATAGASHGEEGRG
ncbi:hypothetical protein [Jidongwangia harbinensis]|uniref:hypothetical protein n=1 Tax=Jidongwangia harbinensis TaxID=2878561 RepID=UPI001CD9485F|nr:hypothetical protein [Jidongwangia harbinensis]MCA2216551.1 hypothetical protein [Jidongwangia harbinensis]